MTEDLPPDPKTSQDRLLSAASPTEPPLPPRRLETLLDRWIPRIDLVAGVVALGFLPALGAFFLLPSPPLGAPGLTLWGLSLAVLLQADRMARALRREFRAEREAREDPAATVLG